MSKNLSVEDQIIEIARIKSNAHAIAKLNKEEPDVTRNSSGVRAILSGNYGQEKEDNK